MCLINNRRRLTMMSKLLFLVAFTANAVLMVSSFEETIITSSSSASSYSSGSSSSSYTSSYTETEENNSGECETDENNNDTEPICKQNERYVKCPSSLCQPQNCSELGYPVPCPIVGPDGQCSGDPGCICIQGYLRNVKGVCVPQKQCPSCGGDPNAQSGCGVNCGRLCSNYNSTEPIVCPKICRLNGCDCKPNYVFDRNINKCVRPKDCTPVCGRNEVFSNCTQAGCQAKNCSQLGYPIPCIRIDPKSCKQGCVCAENYLRADNGTCVPQSQCPSCGGDPNAQSGCGVNCGRLCSNYNSTEPIVCAAICRLNSCDCKPDYVLDQNINKCVRPKDCTPVCGQNEVFSNCTQAGCQAKNCSQLGTPIPCIKIDPKSCKKGCVCAENYLRADNGTCVPQSQCPAKCWGPHEYFDCSVECDNVCENIDIQNKSHCPIINKRCNDKCYCEDGYARNDDNICVPISECKKKVCNGTNEEWVSCPTCSPQTCDSINKTYNCPLQRCNGGCQCKPGFYRNKDGKCVLTQEDCLCGENEVFSSCINGLCRAQNCTQLGRPIACPSMVPGSCKKGCVCKPGYLRTTNGTCVPEKQCLKCTGPHEYFACGGACDNVCATLSQQNQTNCPIINIQCNRKCYCDEGYARDHNNICIPISNCPLKCTGPHEYFACGGACDNVCATLSQQNQTNCPIINIQCNRKCYCDEGYARDNNNICIPIKDCPPPQPTCPDGEIYSECPPIKCDAEYCPKCRNDPLTCPIPTKCGKPRCVCGFNSHRNRTDGKCIATASCPPFPCDGSNEIYDPCPPVCPGQNCSDYLNNATCPRYRIGIVVPCRPQCRCKENYYRNTKGICVKASKCGQRSTTTTTTTTTESPSTNNNSAEEQERLVKGNSAFTGKFLYQVVKKENVSVIASPFSVLIPLAQLALYTNTSTQSYTELISALNLRNKNEIRSVFPSFVSSLENQSDVEFALAAKVYSNEQFELSEAFLRDTKNIFDAEAQTLDFSNPDQAADIINTWVAAQTNDRITDLVSGSMFNALTRLVLTNAIYFKGNWDSQFNPNNTEQRDFHVNNNETVKVKTMYQNSHFNYAESSSLDAKIIELPYKGGNFSFVAILPNQIEGLLDLVAKLQDSDTLNNALTGLTSENCLVYLPSMEIRTSIDLSDVLQKIGITRIFNPATSGLEGILKYPEELFVSAAIQKAFLIVNEVGSEAAAANAIIVGTTSAVYPPPKIYIFDADHPFLYFITLRGIPMFGGVYYGD